MAAKGGTWTKSGGARKFVPAGGGGAAQPQEPSVPGVNYYNMGGGESYYDFTVDGTVVSANTKAVGDGRFEFDFAVGNDLRAQDRTANAEIASKMSQIFRAEVASKPNGTVFETTPALSGDGRQLFREATYARSGFSFKGGKATQGARGKQYGVVKQGKLIPSDSSGNPFTKVQLNAHKAAVKTTTKRAITVANLTKARN